MSEADPAIKTAAGKDWPYGPIFDADAHIDPPHDMWKDYLPSNLKDRAPKIVHEDDGDYIEFEGNRRPFMMISNQAGRDGKNFKMKGRLEEVRKVWEPATRLADMDADGMDAALLFGGGPLGSFDNELYLASYEAYQNWVLDFCSAAPDRLFPVGYVPMRDIDETCQHIERLAKKGFRAINLPAFPQNPDAWKTTSGVKALKDGQVSALTGDPKGQLQYSDPAFDKLWKTVVDNNVVITFHLGGRVPRFGQKEFFLADMPMSKLAMAEPIGIFIFNCIFDRFPDLKIGSMESGVGWFAWTRTSTAHSSRIAPASSAVTCPAARTSCGRRTIRTRKRPSPNRATSSCAISKASPRKTCAPSSMAIAANCSASTDVARPGHRAGPASPA
jgi:predicted TIM-barrel fold metal-dependent hydrolase